MPKLFLDIIRWLLIIFATSVTVKWLWGIHWLLGLLLAVPVFVVVMNVIGFATLPLYGFTQEVSEARRRLKELERRGRN